MEAQDNQQAIEEVWQAVWEPYLTKPGYGVSLTKVKKELFEYYMLMKDLPDLYEEITGGRINDINTPVEDVLTAFEESVETLLQGAIEEIIKEQEEDGNIGMGI